MLLALRDLADQFFMAPNATQLGFVRFHTSASVLTPLISSRTTWNSVLNSASTATYSGTDINMGLTTGLGLLRGSSARANALKVLVLFSDGQQTVGPPISTAIATASTAKAAGTLIVSVAFGQVETVSMMALASTPTSRYYFSAATGLMAVAMLQLERSLCAATQPSVTAGGTIRSAVTSASIRGATVQLRSAIGGWVFNATSASNGAWSISGLSPGRYNATASMSGYSTLTRPVAIASNSTTTG